MQERINAYVQALTVTTKSKYELAARECAKYFDGRGIDYPTADDWKAFEEYFKEKYKREKGKDILETTLQQNYVAKGKHFYTWCANQDGIEQTAPLFEEDKTEASIPPAPDDDMPRPTEASAEREEARPNEAEKRGENVRVNFLLSKGNHEALLSLVYLKGQTLTAILTEAVEKYIQGYSKEIATLEETRRTLRSR